MKPVPKDLKCDPKPRMMPFIVTAPVLRVTPRIGGFEMELRAPLGGVQLVSYQGADIPKWLVSGAVVEVDFERNSITLIHPGLN